MEDRILIDFMNKQSAAMGTVATQVSEMHGRLFGNGKETGELPHLESRVSAVEKKVWYATGFGAAIGTLLSYVGFKLHH